MASMRGFQTKRVYDPVSNDDGFRVLVDRVWPRGVSKPRARADLWLPSVAPSTELRKWFAHDPQKWPEFKRRYFDELDAIPGDLDPLLSAARQGRVTLLYSARDPRHNQAAALGEYLDRLLEREPE